MRRVLWCRVLAFLAMGAAATPAWAAAPPDGEDATTAAPMVANTASEPDCLVMRESEAVMTSVDAASPDDVESATGDDVRALPDALVSGSAPDRSRSWVPSDAERDDDQGASVAWIATDAERENDTGMPSNWIRTVDCDPRHRDRGATSIR